SWAQAPNLGDSNYTVTITATNGDNTVSTASFTVNPTDVAPLVAADNASVTFAEDQTASNTGTWSDYDDSVTLTASIGSVIKNANGTWSWAQAPNLGDSNYTVTITATNGDNTVST